MMKRRDKGGNVYGVPYNNSATRVKNRNDNVYIIRGVILCIIFLSIFP